MVLRCSNIGTKVLSAARAVARNQGSRTQKPGQQAKYSHTQKNSCCSIKLGVAVFQCVGVALIECCAPVSMGSHGIDDADVPPTIEYPAERSLSRPPPVQASEQEEFIMIEDDIVIEDDGEDGNTPCPACAACHEHIKELNNKIKELKQKLQEAEALVNEFLEQPQLTNDQLLPLM